MRDGSLHQKKRATEMMMSLLKDLGDISSLLGGEFKACLYSVLKHNEAELLFFYFKKLLSAKSKL